MVQASVIKALPSRISIAPKGQADRQVSHAYTLSDMNFYSHGNSSLKRQRSWKVRNRTTTYLPDFRSSRFKYNDCSISFFTPSRLVLRACRKGSPACPRGAGGKIFTTFVVNPSGRTGSGRIYVRGCPGA